MPVITPRKTLTEYDVLINPTLSIMALAMRSCTFVAEEMRKGTIG